MAGVIFGPDGVFALILSIVYPNSIRVRVNKAG
jgi:hypothetical protein